MKVNVYIDCLLTAGYKMFQTITAITALLAFHARQIEAQNILATDCYFKSDNTVKIDGLGAPSNPCGVVTPATVRPPSSTNASANESRTL